MQKNNFKYREKYKRSEDTTGEEGEAKVRDGKIE